MEGGFDSLPPEAELRAGDEGLLRAVLAEAGAGVLHIFAYGSLIWRPGFSCLRTRAALALGYHRRLAVYSTVYRGTEKAPGLVFGLEAGGSCKGVVHTVAAGGKERVLRYLFRREMFAGAYLPRFLTVRAEGAGGDVLRAFSFVARRGGRQYARPMPEGAALRLIRRGEGAAGRNSDYILQTHLRLRRLGVYSPQLARLCGFLSAEEGYDKKTVLRGKKRV